ncbi:hypothetical protein [Priestia aryabhattai]|uniref:hypothetical protein n=1 Tax=Priestia aryabhattai TaxID=412384 RepID=UPI001C8D5C85|nr:hypothetical protein [Priestia aryabhattai]MBY0213870.1 hypothetical protein [Priestia aryabhattai]
MNSFQFWVFKIMSWSPFLRVTDDSKFNQVTKNSTQFRFSIISFNMGITSFYFLTWDTSRSFKWKHKLNLYEVQGFYQNINRYENEYDVYLAELDNKSSVNVSAEKDFLTQRISETENTKNKAFNKFLAYIAIFVFILPLYAPKLPNLLPFLTSYKVLYVIVMIYIIANLTFLTIEVIKVKNFTRVTFSNIRNASENEVEKKLNAMMFYELKHHNNEATFEVSVIRNIEKYMLVLILWSIFIIVSSNIEQGLQKASENKPTQSVQKDAAIVTLNVKTETNFNELVKANKKDIESIEDNVLQEKYKKIIVISEKNNKLSSDLIRLLKLYKGKNISIIDLRKKKHPNYIEILMLKE